MQPSIMSQTLTALIPTLQPTWIWGPPAVGKSSIVRAAAAALGIELIDIRAVLLDPVDLRGLPTIGKDGRAKWAVPGFLPSKGRGVLFLDELAQATPLVQAALLQLSLERRLGEYELPEGWAIVAASNRQEDRAGGHRVISALSSRFLHLDMEVHAGDWSAWAVGAGVAPEVRGFIASQPTKLHVFDGAAGERSFPSPRTWEFVSRIMPACTDATMFDLVAGCIGKGHAAEFVAFAQVYRRLPDVDQILRSPATAGVPNEPDVLWAVTTSVVEKCREDKKKSAAAITYADRLAGNRFEFASMLFRDTLKVDKAALKTPQGQAFITKYGERLRRDDPSVGGN